MIVRFPRLLESYLLAPSTWDDDVKHGLHPLRSRSAARAARAARAAAHARPGPNKYGTRGNGLCPSEAGGEHRSGEQSQGADHVQTGTALDCDEHVITNWRERGWFRAVWATGLVQHDHITTAQQLQTFTYRQDSCSWNEKMSCAASVWIINERVFLSGRYLVRCLLLAIQHVALQTKHSFMCEFKHLEIWSLTPMKPWGFLTLGCEKHDGTEAGERSICRWQTPWQDDVRSRPTPQPVDGVRHSVTAAPPLFLPLMTCSYAN